MEGAVVGRPTPRRPVNGVTILESIAKMGEDGEVGIFSGSEDPPFCNTALKTIAANYQARSISKHPTTLLPQALLRRILRAQKVAPTGIWNQGCERGDLADTPPPHVLDS